MSVTNQTLEHTKGVTNKERKENLQTHSKMMQIIRKIDDGNAKKNKVNTVKLIMTTTPTRSLQQHLPKQRKSRAQDSKATKVKHLKIKISTQGPGRPVNLRPREPILMCRPNTKRHTDEAGPAKNQQPKPTVVAGRTHTEAPLDRRDIFHRR